jgi:cytochrome c oxidase accessory protein FixG
MNNPNLVSLGSINDDGSKRTLHPADVSGRFTRARRLMALLILLVYVALPWIPVNGFPAVFLDVLNRRFHFMGLTLAVQDLWVGFFLVTGLGFSLFYVTALFGRVWCGWGCPQTVYLELVFRPIERLVLGAGSQRRSQANGLQLALLYVAYFVIAFLMAHIFLAYFVPVETLWGWLVQPPTEHLTSFIVVVAVTALILADFVFFREQMCTLACPYGRLQSVLLDKRSLVVGYDVFRGEPRGKAKPSADAGTLGDCVDCKACVATCPTGIDIRKGLQMECVACTQCIDACDGIMERLGREPGLIRYMTPAALGATTVAAEARAAGDTTCRPAASKTGFRFRPLIYGTLVVAAFTTLGIVSARKGGVEVAAVRDKLTPFQLMDGDLVSNSLHLRIRNRAEVELRRADGALAVILQRLPTATK